MKAEVPTNAAIYPATRLSLIDRLKDWSDNRSWSEFAAIYSPFIVAVARKAGLRESEADEVLQATLLMAAEKLQSDAARYRPAGGPFRGWLLNIVRWKILETLKRRKRQEREVSGGADDVLATLADPSSTDIEGFWEMEWKAKLTSLAMDNVKQKVAAAQFQIFQLYVLHGETPKQVSEQLGVSYMQVYLAKHRVGLALGRELKRLRRELE